MSTSAMAALAFKEVEEGVEGALALGWKDHLLRNGHGSTFQCYGWCRADVVGWLIRSVGVLWPTPEDYLAARVEVMRPHRFAQGLASAVLQAGKRAGIWRVRPASRRHRKWIGTNAGGAW